MAIRQNVLLLAPVSGANHERLHRQDAKCGLYHGAIAGSGVSLTRPLNATPDKSDPRHATCVERRAERNLDQVTCRVRRNDRTGLLRAARVGSIAYLFFYSLGTTRRTRRHMTHKYPPSTHPHLVDGGSTDSLRPGDTVEAKGGGIA